MGFWQGFEKQANYISKTFKRLGATKLERSHMASQIRKGRRFLAQEQPGASYATKQKGYSNYALGRAGGKEITINHSQVGLPHGIHEDGKITWIKGPWRKVHGKKEI